MVHLGFGELCQEPQALTEAKVTPTPQPAVANQRSLERLPVLSCRADEVAALAPDVGDQLEVGDGYVRRQRQARVRGRALLAAGFYALLWLITRAGFGFGDVRYVPIVAAPTAALGWATLVSALVVGSVLALAHGTWLRVRGHAGLQPWAPSLVGGRTLRS
jgi:hypothetical protein